MLRNSNFNETALRVTQGGFNGAFRG